MNTEIALLLAQDGLTNGAIYALLALALVLVFSVTRVIFIPQGEFVAFGTLTLATLNTGQVPGTLWLLLAGAVLVLLVEAVPALRCGEHRRAMRCLLYYGAVPAMVAAVIWWVAPMKLGLPYQIAMSLAIVIPLGPILYRLAYQRLAEASVLVLLIVSVAAHLVLGGVGLLFFGAEGSRTPAFSTASFRLGEVSVSGQSLWIYGASLALIMALYLFFRHSIYGKALRATAVNRTGARLMGISAPMAGSLAFTLAAAIGALSGILIGPVTTVFYDTGFLIGLKGFVGAIVGGLVSFPLAAAGALLVGLLESYSSFWASAFKEVIVFTLIIPVLLWRSLTTHHAEED